MAPVPDNPDYLAKYHSWITGGPWGSAEVFAQTYSVPLRFRPDRVRGHRCRHVSSPTRSTAPRRALASNSLAVL